MSSIRAIPAAFWRPIFVLAALLLCVPTRAQVFPDESIELGSDPRDLAVVDLDADGTLDVVVCSDEPTGSLSVVLGKGSGDFAQPSSYVAYEATALAVADLDADGDLDVVTVNGSSPSLPVAHLTIFLGDGSGVLASAGTVPLTFTAFDMQSGDFDLDGLPDLVATSWSSSMIAVAPNLGGASFGSFAAVAHVVAPADLVVADVDGDGDADLLAPHAQTSIAMAFGDGAGGFTVQPALPACVNPTAIAAADFTLDGRIDLALACSPGAPYELPTGASIAIYAGTGSGGFVLDSSRSITPYVRDLAAADADGDGQLDVAAATYIDYALLLGSPSGLLPASHWLAGGGPVEVELVDLDGDGRRDLIGLDTEVRLMWGQGAGSFSAARVWRYGAPTYVGSGADTQVALAAADLDADGAIELCIPYEGGALALLSTNGAGGVSKATHATTAKGIRAARSVQLDGDGVPDLLVIGTDPPAIHAQRGDGQGGVLPYVSLPLASEPMDMDVGDFDGDGSGDAVVASGNAVVVAHSDGGGGFGGVLSLPFSNPPPNVVAAGDVDVDGDIDVVGMGWKLSYYGFGSLYSDANYSVFLNDGAGGFNELPKATDLDFAPSDLGFGDVSADGLPDMLAIGKWMYGSPVAIWSPRLTRYFGLGAGKFSGAKDYEPEHESAVQLWIADLNGDGRADALTAAGVHSEYFQTEHDSTLAVPQDHLSGFGPGVLLDLDGDGWLDIARSASLGTAVWKVSIVSILPHVGKDHAGVSAFGVGTPGCSGTLGIDAASVPKIGNDQFALQATNSPPETPGFGFLATDSDLPGSDPFGLGILLHADPLASAAFLPFGFEGGAGGIARAELPIPDSSAIAGTVLYAQGFWFQPPWLACGSAFLGLESSRGLRIVIQQ